MEDKYIMKCGCELSKEDLIFKKGGRKCPVHFESIDRIIRKCSDCHKIMDLQSEQWPKLRCDECREKRRVRVHTESCKSWRKNKEKSVDGIGLRPSEIACFDRSDCLHRQYCFDKAIKTGKDNRVLPCAGCDRYEKTDII